jgi:hypothetical protein
MCTDFPLNYVFTFVKSAVAGNQPVKNVARQRRNDRREPLLRPGRSAGGISECESYFANKTCQSEPLASVIIPLQ